MFREGQGDCILKCLEEMLPVFIVPGGPHSLVLRPSLDLLILFHNRSGEPSNERLHVDRTRVVPTLPWTEARSLLVKSTYTMQW